MSDEESSEEKSLPPSLKKLREARRKGQIAKSTDMISAVSVTLLTLYLLFAWPGIQAEFARMFDVAARAAARSGPSSWQAAIQETGNAAGNILIPLYLIGFVAIVLGAVISNKGIIFSFEPLKPKLSHIHPVKGFKRIFSIRNLIEFIKALVKSLLLMGALGLSAWYGISAVLRIPYCGSGCVAEALAVIAMPLVVLAVLLFLFAALVDLSVQKWLFTRDMRMTHTELKREMKETFGDPHIRSARKDLQRDAVAGDTGKATKYLKDRKPTFVICANNDVAIGLRYVPGETAAPVVVAKATGQRARLLIRDAVNARLIVENDSDLAHDLLKRAKMDSFIPESAFRSVARILSR